MERGNYFLESIAYNKEFISFERLKEVFAKYISKKVGYVSDEFLDLKIIRTEDDLDYCGGIFYDEDSHVLYVSDEVSIIDFFHKMKQISGAWKDKNNSIHYGFEDSLDHDSCFESVDLYSSDIAIKYPIKGLFLESTIDELFAFTMFEDVIENGYDKNKVRYDLAVSRDFYDEQILLYLKICSVLGIDPEYLLLVGNKNNGMRRFLEREFYNLTGTKDCWSILEERLDYIATFLLGKNEIGYVYDKEAEEKYQSIKNNIDSFFISAVVKAQTKNRISREEFSKRANRFHELPSMDEYASIKKTTLKVKNL